MTLVQTADIKLSLSHRIYALLELLSLDENRIEIPEDYEIYTQAYYGERVDGFMINVRSKADSASTYILRVRCIDGKPSKTFHTSWWIIDQSNFRNQRNHIFDEAELPSKLSYDESHVVISVIRNKLYRGAKELDALYGVRRVMEE